MGDGFSWQPGAGGERQEPPRPRNEGRPLRAFRESHPTFGTSILVLVAVIALAILTAHHFLHWGYY